MFAPAWVKDAIYPADTGYKLVSVEVEVSGVKTELQPEGDTYSFVIGADSKIIINARAKNLSEAVVGNFIHVDGKVMQQGKNGYLIDDGVAGIYIYDANLQMTVGSYYHVDGTVGTYGGATQITSPTVTEIQASFEPSEATALTTDKAAELFVEAANVVTPRQMFTLSYVTCTTAGSYPVFEFGDIDVEATNYLASIVPLAKDKVYDLTFYVAGQYQNQYLTITLVSAEVRPSLQASIDSSSIQVGNTAQITAQVVDGTGDYTFSYSGYDADVISVDDQGEVTTIAEGETSITVSVDGYPTMTKTIEVIVTAASFIEHTNEITFSVDTNSGPVGGYTSSFTTTVDDFTITLNKFNNNNNGWSYVRCGQKNTASVATITTRPVSYAVKTVTLTIDSITAKDVNSITIQAYSDADMTKAVGDAKTFSKATGNQSITFDSPAENLYYKITFDCANTNTKNGFLQLSKVVFSNL